MLAPGFNCWGQVFLHFGTSPPSRIQPKPLAAKMQPGPAADPKPQAWCEAKGWAEMRDIASVRAAAPGPPLPTPGLSGFRVPLRRSGARSRAAKTEKAAWKALKASTPPEQLAAAGT